MRFARALLLTGCIGSIAAGCTSDLKLSLEGLRCNAEERCSDGYACQRDAGICVRNVVGDEPVFPGGTNAGGSGHPSGGGGSGHAGAGGSSGGVGGSEGVAGQGGAGGSELDGGLYDPSDGGDGCAPTTVYRDEDNDEFGAEDRSRVGCPGNGWVLDGTDCRDDIAEVKPGQTEFFRTGYDTPAGTSFDYDCSGIEEPSPNNDLDPVPTCTGLGVTCNDVNGYLPAADPPREGPGVDPRCGSIRRRGCSDNGPLSECVPEDTELSESQTFVCH